jgi:hypothetical protein
MIEGNPIPLLQYAAALSCMSRAMGVLAQSFPSELADSKGGFLLVKGDDVERVCWNEERQLYCSHRPPLDADAVERMMVSTGIEGFASS